MIWRPHQGPQEKALQRQEYEVLYGGARGGGKTDAGLVWLTDNIENPRFRGLVIRKNAKDLSDWVDRAARMYTGLGVKIGYQPPVLKFPSGAIIRCGHLKDEHAFTQYQGHEYQRELIEELTQIASEKLYLELISSCRSTVEGIKPQIFATTNPGGIGHGWVKKRWKIDEYPDGGTVTTDNTSGRTRIFIKSTLDDNPTLMGMDPDYAKSLDALADVDPELYKAWRLGDWNTFAGQYFKEFRNDLHTMPAFMPKNGLYHIGGLDWGRTDPFAFYASIIYPVNFEKDGIVYKFYRVITYREFYGTEKAPKVWAEEIRNGLSLMGVRLQDFQWVQADTQLFNPANDGSKSLADHFIDDSEEWRRVLKPASKDRVPGWENMHSWLSLAPDGKPYWIITKNCINLIRTLPELIHDENLVEDVDTTGEDHAGDSTRYMLKALKWIDAFAGAVKHKGALNPNVKTIPNPVMDIDLDAFGSGVEKTRDWRTI